ncbi:MAG TPA: c-type cytochrome [Bryobacteraceae bacterium]|nr:c-type cytochrome [Bryobacteraceae bacterium]
MKTAIFALVLAAPLFAQHEATQGDIDDGRRLYLANCARCHGPEGNAVPGVELGRQIRRAATDEGVAAIIIKGIPNTAMPPHRFSEFQAGTVVAYLRFMAKSAADSSVEGADPARGKLIFEGRGGCVNCHRVRDTGSRLGPDLTDIGTQRRAVELRKSLLEPDAEVLPQNRIFRVVTKDGKTINGRLLNQDAFTIQILDTTQHLQSYQKSALASWAFAEHSPMPSVQGKLSPAEITDLVGYLVSLKGIENQ